MTPKPPLPPRPTSEIVKPGAAGRRFGARTALIAVAFILVTVPFLLLLLLVEDNSAGLRRLDGGARDSMHEFALDHPVFVDMMRALSWLGSSPVWWTVFTIVVVWLLWSRLPRLSTFVAVTALLSSLLNGAVKELVHRARPLLTEPVAHASGQSFPSGHAQAALVGYGILVLVFLPVLPARWRRVAIGVAAFLVLAIGFSRIALGVHYASDVLAGYVLGAAWLAAMTAAFSAWRRERGRPRVRPSEGLEPEQAERIAPHPTPSGTPPE